MSSLKRVLKQVKADLEKKERMREDAHDSMRKATSLSKQSILHVHQKRYGEAKKLIEKAKEIIVELQKTSQACPEIVQGGLFDAARQEYSEANILLSLVEESRFATPTEIQVPPIDYVLGLADVIGEYRRLALDALREGDVKKGENCLQTMDNIYVELMALDEAYTLVPGLRRKCDVARKIIEATRGDITQEVGRNALEKHLRQLERTVERARREQRANH
jgi:translin